MAPMAVLRGLQRYDLVNLVDITSMILTTAASVIILIMGKGIIGLILVNITGMLFVMLFSGLLVRKVAPELHFGWRGADRKFIRSVLGYSWPLFVKDVSYRLQTKTDEITVGAFLPLQAIAPYNLARKLSESIYTLTKQFMKVLLPLASELHAENDRVRLRSVFVTGTRLALAISIGIGSILIALRQPVLLLWVGKGYENAGPLIVILTIATFVSTSLWPAGAVLQGMARHRVLALTSFCNGLANLGISLALIKPLGLMGVALGTLIPNVLEFFVLMPFAMRVIGVSWGRALQDIFLPSIGPVVPMALTFYVLLRMLEPANLFVTIFVAACGFCVFMMSYLSLGITQIERKTAQGIAFSVFQIARTQIRRSE
jgi:O-antigen/teichoic acid export membrane protein